jgi:transcriptional regulator with XRE-family HTH domain
MSDRIDSEINPQLVGQRLRQVRQERGLTQTQVAKNLDMNLGNYNEIEHGKRLSFHVKTLYRLCQALEVSADYLLGLREGTTDGPR